MKEGVIGISETNEKWIITDEEREKYINALVDELPSLRAKVRPMSWSTFLSLILFFDSHKTTHKLLRSLSAFPYELWSRFNDGIAVGELNLNSFIGMTEEDLMSKLDEQALYTIRTVLMVEYARCTRLSSEAVVKSFDGKLFNRDLSEKDIQIRETLKRIRGNYV